MKTFESRVRMTYERSGSFNAPRPNGRFTEDKVYLHQAADREAAWCSALEIGEAYARNDCKLLTVEVMESGARALPLDITALRVKKRK